MASASTSPGPPAGQRPLLDDDEPVRLLAASARIGVRVERPERAEVDHLGVDPGLRERLGRGQALVDAAHRRDERDVAPCADDRSLADRGGLAPSTSPSSP